MIVRTRGKSEKLTIPEVKFATEFVFAHLATKSMHDSVTVTVSFIEPNKKEKARGLYGYAIKRDDTTYTIQINKNLSRRKQLITLCHELVHVKQFCKGQLGDSIKIDGSIYTVWKKKTFSEDDLLYFFTPWEIEAAGMEWGLYKIYEEYVTEQKLIF